MYFDIENGFEYLNTFNLDSTNNFFYQFIYQKKYNSNWIYKNIHNYIILFLQFWSKILINLLICLKVVSRTLII